MLSTCSCGKKLVFGDDPDEVQTCDRCGQRVHSPMSGHAEDAAQPALPRGPRRQTGTPAPKKEAPPPSGRMSWRLTVASERKSPAAKLGCVFATVFFICLLFGLDYIVRPSGMLACGHEGKRSYAFGLVAGHRCEGQRALEYLNMARRENLRRDSARIAVLERMEDLQAVPAVGGPPEGTPYEFVMTTEGGFMAFPADEASTLPRYMLEIDGTVRMETGKDPTHLSPAVGSF